MHCRGGKSPIGVDEQVNGRFDAFAFGEDNGNLAYPISKPGRKAGGLDIQKSETGICDVKHNWHTFLSAPILPYFERMRLVMWEFGHLSAMINNFYILFFCAYPANIQNWEEKFWDIPFSNENFTKMRAFLVLWSWL